MITLILAVCLLWAVLAGPDSRKWVRDGAEVSKWIGLLVAVGVILSSVESLGGVRPARIPAAFSTGALVPSVSEERPHRISITYIERSWWGLRVEGRWTARPDEFGKWEYLDNERGWLAVPWQIFETPDGDPVSEYDNRGYREVR